MRRLRNSRAPDPDELAEQGFDRSDLEGDAIAPVVDEIPWLRPFGADIPGPLLAEAAAPAEDGEPEPVRVLRQAAELARLGRRLDAILLLRRSLEDGISTGDPEARSLLAELLEQSGDPENALTELTLALDSVTDRSTLLVRRGALQGRIGKLAEAESDLRDALRQRPAFAPGHYHLGLVLLRRGRAADAAETFRESLRLGPDDPDTHYQLGEALQAQGDLAAALQALERAAQLAPADARAYKLMGRLLDRLGRTDDAMAMHRKAREASIR